MTGVVAGVGSVACDDVSGSVPPNPAEAATTAAATRTAEPATAAMLSRLTCLPLRGRPTAPQLVLAGRVRRLVDRVVEDLILAGTGEPAPELALAGDRVRIGHLDAVLAHACGVRTQALQLLRVHVVRCPTVGQELLTRPHGRLPRAAIGTGRWRQRHVARVRIRIGYVLAMLAHARGKALK
ncbi:hypothetical protein ACFQYP_57120 [Nonomuraea antimicrobica]